MEHKKYLGSIIGAVAVELSGSLSTLISGDNQCSVHNVNLRSRTNLDQGSQQLSVSTTGLVLAPPVSTTSISHPVGQKKTFSNLVVNIRKLHYWIITVSS